MLNRSVIIIGAGIAGLSAGCYSQMNGYESRIFEMHSLPGGLCTTWKRKGYSIDGCVRFLVGCKPENAFFTIWQELGALKGHRMIEPEEYMRIEDEDGKALILHTDINRLERHMKEIAPEDAEAIEAFVNGVRACIPYQMPIEKAPEVCGPTDYAKLTFRMLPFMGLMMKWRKVSVSSFAKRFKNPLLRQAFLEIIGGETAGGGYLDMPMIGGLQQFAWFHNRVAAYPSGGSLAFAQAIQERYQGLGGEISFNSRVERILVENDKATGIRLIDGSEYRADAVISAADGHATVFDMLGGNYVSDAIHDYYENLPVWPPLVQVAIGVPRTFDEMPPSVEGINFPLNPPIEVDGRALKRLSVHIHNHDDNDASSEKIVLKVKFFADFQRWKKLRQDPGGYAAEKLRIADEVIRALDTRFPGLKARVDMVDVATPVTYERYTGNWLGSYQGWLITPRTMGMRMKKTLPGLGSFYMAGQWVEVGGGLPAAAMSGRHVVQIMCRQHQKQFVTSTA